MDLSLDYPGNHLFVRGIGEQGIRIGDEWFTRSFLLSLDKVVADWPPQSLDQFNEAHIKPIVELQPEVVLFGTGPRHAFLSHELTYRFYQNSLGLEMMTTEAACRTFNVLAAEGRKVVAALMPLRD